MSLEHGTRRSDSRPCPRFGHRSENRSQSESRRHRRHGATQCRRPAPSAFHHCGAFKMIDLSDRRAVVTGASRGIGQAIATALARAGADVCTFGLADSEFEGATEAAVRATGRKVMVIEGDVGNQDQVQACADRIRAEWGGVDIWVNNAGRLLIRSFLQTTPQEFHSLMNSNLFGYV